MAKRRNFVNIPLVLELDKAWFAGLVDGEGYIGLLKTRFNRHSIRLGINMTDFATIKRCGDIWGGGSINLLHNGGLSKDGCQRKPLWRWCVSSRQALIILQAIEPFLFTKQKLAQKAIGIGLLKRESADIKDKVEGLLVSHFLATKAGAF